MADEILFKAMAETTRRRLLQVLSEQELSVSELVHTLEQPQSTISRHLKVLRESGLLVDRRVGTTVLYSTSPYRKGATDAPNGRGAHGRNGMGLRDQMLEWAAQQGVDDRIRDRINDVLRRRPEYSNEFFDTIGSRWDQLRVEAFGEVFQFEALTALLPADWTVADIGTGTGYLLPMLAERFNQVIAIDPSEAMLDTAKNRPELADRGNVDFREGALSQLPLADGEADLVIASLVLHHVASPPDALGEIRRCVVGGGRLLVIEQAPHGNAEFQSRMGDERDGIAPDELKTQVTRAGFADVEISRLTTVHSAPRFAGQVPGLYALAASAPEQSGAPKAGTGKSKRSRR
jgi:ArsR family transcriptional regulator